MASPPDRELHVFRITAGPYPVYDGGGAFRYGGRWSSPGRYVINAASTFSLALLENIVHWNRGALPPRQRYVRALIPADLGREVLDAKLFPGWNGDDYRTSQAFGDAWYDSRRTAVLIVPSVLSPYEPNVLVNALHPDARRIEVEAEQAILPDSRLRK